MTLVVNLVYGISIRLVKMKGISKTSSCAMSIKKSITLKVKRRLLAVFHIGISKNGHKVRFVEEDGVGEEKDGVSGEKEVRVGGEKDGVSGEKEVLSLIHI